MEYKYFSAEQVIGVYHEICQIWNQPVWGVLNRNALESAIARPQNAANFENADLIRQAAYLLHGLVQAHAFVDANKRIAFVTTSMFLKENNFQIKNLPNGEVSQFVLSIAKNEIDLDNIENWLRERVVPIN